MKNTTAVVLVSIVVAASLHLLVDIKTHGRRPDQYRIALAALILLAFLLLIGELWPDGAQGLALVIMLTAFVVNGQQFFALIISLVDDKKGVFHV